MYYLGFRALRCRIRSISNFPCVFALTQALALTLDRLSVLQFERKDPALPGVIVGVTFLCRQCFESRLDESHSLEPVQCSRCESEHPIQSRACGLVDQIRNDLSSHA